MCNLRSVDEGWGSPGVFAPGIGPEYDPGGNAALLYVGKSAGPLGGLVGSSNDQAASLRASASWMVEKKNPSSFWQMLDLIQPSRRQVAWTNVCKMDARGGKRPPSPRQWSSIAHSHVKALREEIEFLLPRVVVFATSGYCSDDIGLLLQELGYEYRALDFEDGLTRLLAGPRGQFAIETWHPQGWSARERDRLVRLVRRLLG